MDNYTKLYVLVDDRLNPVQRTVQACHAVHEFMYKAMNTLDLPTEAVDEWATRHKTVIVLGVSDEAQLLSWEKNLTERADVYWASFREPDRNNQLTAIAALPPANFF